MRRKPTTAAGLAELGRVRLSPHFFLRDFLFSDIAAIHRLSNVPDDPDIAIRTGTRLCTDLLEPLQATFGRIAIRSAYRSAAVNALGNRLGDITSYAAPKGVLTKPGMANHAGSHEPLWHDLFTGPDPAGCRTPEPA